MRNFEAHRLALYDVMNGVGQFQRDVVRPRCQALYDNRFAVGMDPMPGGIVNRNMQMTDTRSDAQSWRSIERHELHVFQPEGQDHRTFGQRPRERGVDNEVRRWLSRCLLGSVRIMVLRPLRETGRSAHDCKCGEKRNKAAHHGFPWGLNITNH